ncbi:MAG: glycosyltransferase [Planctomycetota bacterium]
MESKETAGPPGEPDVSVVVPVYGGEATLGLLVDGLRAAASAKGWRLEVLLVCDRPRDGSWAVAKDLAGKHPEVCAILLRRNFGQHPATLLGIRRARGSVIVTMDEDLQHNPADVPALVDECRRTGGIAYGVARALPHSGWRNIASRVSKWFLAHYVGVKAAQQMSAFRAFPASLRDAFENYHGERVAIDVLLSWSGAPVSAVSCVHDARQAGKSGYTFRKLLSLLGDLLLGFSTAPLRVASMIGLFFVLVSIGIGAYVFIGWLHHGPEGPKVPGFAFQALAISLFGGVQLLAIGVIGEYLGRLYFGSLGRPQYLVEEVARSGNDGIVPSDARAGIEGSRPPAAADSGTPPPSS